MIIIIEGPDGSGKTTFSARFPLAQGRRFMWPERSDTARNTTTTP